MKIFGFEIGVVSGFQGRAVLKVLENIVKYQ